MNFLEHMLQDRVYSKYCCYIARAYVIDHAGDPTEQPSFPILIGLFFSLNNPNLCLAYWLFFRKFVHHSSGFSIFLS